MEWQTTQNEDARGVIRKDGVVTEGGADVSKGLTNCVMPSHFAPNRINKWFSHKNTKRACTKCSKLADRACVGGAELLGLRSNTNL